MKLIIVILLMCYGVSGSAQINEFGTAPIFSEVNRVSLTVMNMVDDNCITNNTPQIERFIEGELRRNHFSVTSYSRYMPKVKVILKGYALSADYNQCSIMLRVTLMDNIQYVKHGRTYNAYVDFGIVNGILSGERGFIEPALRAELSRSIQYLRLKQREAHRNW